MSGCESVDKTQTPETKCSKRQYKLLPGEKPPTKFRRRNLVPREKPEPPADDKYKCGVCPQYFPRKSLLAQHVSMHMDSNGRWPCKDCSKSYQRRHELIIHSRIHTGLRPYKLVFPYSDCSNVLFAFIRIFLFSLACPKHTVPKNS